MAKHILVVFSVDPPGKGSELEEWSGPHQPDGYLFVALTPEVRAAGKS